MTDFFQKPKPFHFIYWAHAYWKGISGTVLVILGGIPTTVLKWDTMSRAEALVAITGITVTAIKSLDMFLDQTTARLAAGKTPVKLEGQNGNDTSHITKSGSTLQ